ncbi:hypothetical protein [Streptomyces sp. NPDC014995]|uniref:hypothetical protein n=1 Tax=Streptomyces sp. NPDC014995 TaxID=3364936 RepID=UPI0036FB6C95
MPEEDRDGSGPPPRWCGLEHVPLEATLADLATSLTSHALENPELRLLARDPHSATGQVQTVLLIGYGPRAWPPATRWGRRAVAGFPGGGDARLSAGRLRAYPGTPQEVVAYYRKAAGRPREKPPSPRADPDLEVCFTSPRRMHRP